MQAAFHHKTDTVSFSRNQLKALTAVTMTADHVGYMLFTPPSGPSGILPAGTLTVYEVLRLAGRISFPLVCFFLVQGMHHTHDRRKYLLRLFLFALLSEIPFDLAIRGRLFDWRSQNVLFTLVIGLCVLFLLERAGQTAFAPKRNCICLLVVLAGAAAAYMLHTDYSFWGILTIFLFYPDRFQARQRFWCMAALCACQGPAQMFAVLSLFFTERYDGQKGKRQSLPQQYFFYLFYPLHLLVLFSLQAVL